MEILARAVGRRKEAVAQVQMVRGSGQFVINAKPAQEYLQNDSCSILDVHAPFEILKNYTGNAFPGEAGGQGAYKSGLDSQNSDHRISHITELNNVDTIVKVKGGGLKGQAEAIRLGIARALCLLDTNALDSTKAEVSLATAGQTQNSLNGASSSTGVGVRKGLKDKGYLTQDSRVKERRKYGLKKARKATQYNKR